MTKGSPENEFFIRESAERQRKIAQDVARQTAEAEKQRLKELHWLRCPKCGMQMAEVKFRGLDVDVCFACDGIFLDKREIDAIAAPQQKGIMAAILNWFSDVPQK